MNDLQTYLNRYYQTAEQLAASCNISVDELALLVHEELVPQPSYIVNASDILISKAFGELPAGGAEAGHYFHPGNAAWIALAVNAKKTFAPREAHSHLRDRFKRNFAAALKCLDKTTFRLSDSFTDDGQPVSGRLDARSEAAWGYFLGGVFSLCVADPSTEMSIARKEILQEALNAVDNDCVELDSSPENRKRVLDLIDHYAQAAMPFSPPEYPRSSRKRLVDDLRAKLSSI